MINSIALVPGSIPITYYCQQSYRRYHTDLNFEWYLGWLNTIGTTFTKFFAPPPVDGAVSQGIDIGTNKMVNMMSVKGIEASKNMLAMMIVMFGGWRRQ